MLTLYEIDDFTKLIFHNNIGAAIATALSKICDQSFGYQLVSHKFLQAKIAGAINFCKYILGLPLLT